MSGPLPTARLGTTQLGSAVVLEALASARSQRVATLASLLIMAAVCATVLLTAGRAVGAEREVLGSIDSARARTIVVRADEAAQVDTSVVSELASVRGITWVGAFSRARDVRNTAFPGGAPVPVREVWAPDLSALGIGRESGCVVDCAYASPEALHQLGMADAAGGVSDGEGRALAVRGGLRVPESLTALEPLVVVPRDVQGAPGPLGVLVVVAERPELVEPVRDTVVSLLAVTDPATITVETSDDLTALRDVVAGQLRRFSRSLVAGVLLTGAILVAGVQLGVVVLRRRDFGRRRALGASQRLIISLLVTQTLLTTIAGAVVGTSAAIVGLVVSESPVPGLDFILAVAVLAVTISALAALAPAVVASRRDPLTELRVP